MTDLNHIITYINPAFLRLFEVSDSQEFINQEFLHERFWIDPEKRAIFLKDLGKEFIKRKELFLKTSKGRKIYITILSSFTIGIQGQINGYQGTIYDVTTRKELSALKKAEEALRENEKKWRLLAENVPDVIASVDKDGRIQFLNHSVTGFDLEDVIGTFIYEYVSSDQHQIVKRTIENVFQTGNPDSYKVIASGQHGPNTSWETRVVPIMHDSQVVGLNLISTDITERMKAQNRQARLMEQVNKINRELNDFAHIVSHDLKEPLRTIKIVAKWISDDYTNILDEKGKEHLELLSNQINRMYDMIDGILKYSKTGYLKNQKEWIHLNDLMPQIISMVSIPDHIDITIDDALPVIEFERTQITQVFQNLLSNAVKYINKPHGKIRIGCVEEAGRWRFSVSDNGAGIKKENHLELQVHDFLQVLTTTRWYTTRMFGLFFVFIMFILILSQTNFTFVFFLTVFFLAVLIIQIYETFLQKEF